MMTHLLTTNRHAISLIETVLSMIMVSFVLITTLQLVAPYTRSTSLQADKLIASNLANELAEEIATKHWCAPGTTDFDFIGPIGDETRSTYNDIDDYHGWISSPPKRSDESVMTELTDWSRKVTVEHVLLSDPSTTSNKHTGLKSVKVTVLKSGTPLATITSLHSKAACDLGFTVD